MTKTEKLHRIDAAEAALDRASNNLGIGPAREAMAAVRDLCPVLREWAHDLPNPPTRKRG